MRAAAGWPREGQCFYLKRAVDPPEALRREVFPWVDGWLERYRLASLSGATFAEGGLDNDPDLSGEVLLRLLSVLRDVFLQDAAVLQARYPENPLWRHTVFRHPAWRPFADQVLAAHEIAEEPEDLQIRRALPVLAGRVSAVHNHLEGKLAGLEQGLGRLVAAEGSQTRSLVRDEVSELKTLVQQAIAQPKPLLTNVPPSALPAQSQAAMLRGSPLPVLNPAALPPASGSGSAAGELVQQAQSSSRSSVPVLGRGPRPVIGPNVACEPEGWPTEPINPAVKTARDAWREWKEGLGEGMPSIQALDAHWDRRWRYKPGNAMHQWHSRRRKLVLYVEWRLQQAGFDRDGRAGEALSDILDELDARRANSLYRLCEELGKELPA
jgi:hypothetical protein